MKIAGPPPPPTREQFKPPEEGSSSALRLDVLDLWVNSSLNNPEKVAEGYRVTIGGRAMSQVKVGGVKDPELRFREFGLQFLEVASTAESWFDPFREWKARLTFRVFDTGGYAVITDDWIDLMLEPTAFHGLLGAVQAKDVSEVRLCLQTDLLQQYSFDDGPLFIPMNEKQHFGRAYISDLSFKSRLLALNDPVTNVPDQPSHGLVEMAKHLREANKLLLWIATVLTGLAVGWIFHR